MPQQTNLNISPYYDDFDREKNYHRVLFKPGFPVQARELTTLQSILQDQIEKFGSHLFKEGSVVIPGGVTFDDAYFAVKLDPTHLGIDVEVYLKNIVGKRIKGQTTEITAKVINYLSAVDSESSDPTIYVKYLKSGASGEFRFFDNSEILQLEESVTYGNTTINAGSSFASTISEEACVTASAVSVDEGVFFVRGNFVRTPSQTIILDQYTNTPSYRVGFKIVETFVNAKEDPTLYDNAKGFSNFAAPGADRLKIQLVLFKKEPSDLDDTDFIELIRVRNGFVEKEINTTQYSLIRDYFAKRTYDESGDYTVRPFFINVLDSLNDRVGSEGLYYEGTLTAEGNSPSEDLACYRVSPGTAYVKGYEYDIRGRTVDIEKPRTTSEFQNEAFTFDLGNRIRLNGVSGITTFRNTVDLMLGNQVGVSSAKIGEAKVYNFGLVDSKYENASTEFDIWLYDINTYTVLYLNDNVSSTEVPISAYIKGVNSGASGYAVSAGAGSSAITITQVAGNFQTGEKIAVNGKESVVTRTIERFVSYNFNDVDALQQSNTFYGKKKLIDKVPFGFAPTDNVTITSGGVVTANGRTFDRFNPGDVIRYKDPTKSVPSQNVVATVTADGASMTVVGMSTVSTLFDGGLPGIAYTGTFRIGQQDLIDEESGLYLRLPQRNISDIDFSGSNILLSEQITGETTDAGGVLVINTSSLSLQDVSFVAFDQERYQIQYSDGTIAEIDGSQVSVTSSAVTINGLTPSASGIKVNVTVSKSNIKNKVKENRRSEKVSITYSNDPASGSNANTSVNDGLTYNQYYGLRVQDDDICLNYPDVYKVLAVYESLNNDPPVLDKLSFTSTDDIFNNAIVGEDIVGETSNAVARVVDIDLITSTISIVYKTNDKFNVLETLLFQESNARATAQTILPGKYKNLTKSYLLDKGQREQFYDYSRLKRINNTAYVPSRKLLVVLDRYEVASTDTGDVFTVNSYDQERFKIDIPLIGKSKFRATDALDFRPRVSTFVPASATISPFFYTNRTFTNLPSRIVTPNESSNFLFKYYYGRTDKIIIKSNGSIIAAKGTPSANPKPPADDQEGMTLATIQLPPYLYDIADARVYLIDNRRYTMRDIGRIEDRVENLEQVTTLSLLEQNIQTLQVKDADGLDRFKSGFFADSLRTLDFVDPRSPIEVDTVRKEMRPLRDLNSFSMQPTPAELVTPQSLDLTENFALLDSNAQKTGRMVTLKYEEVEFVSQKFATRVENLNPYLVWNYTGEITMNPTIDQWITVVEQDGDTDRDQINFTQERSNASQFFGSGQGNLPGRVVRNVSRSTQSQDIRSENTFIASEDFDPFMRSRNLEYSATALRPNTRYYVYFDDVANLDVIPKILPIGNVIGSFIVGETVSAIVGGITYRFRLCRPDHKEGPFNAPTRVFTQNPIDPAESLPTGYSQGSTVLNIDTAALAAEAQGDFFGYLPVGVTVFGETSGAQAVVSSNALFSDDFGDLNGAIWIRNPETVPPPPSRVRSGVREFKLSSSATNQDPVRGSTTVTFARTDFQATGTTRIVQTDVRITTIQTTTVQETFVRIPPPPPPPPPAWPPGRDPLAQSFRTGEDGAFITSVDLFFFQKDTDPSVPVFVEIRTMELGTPTERLASQDARVVIGPDDIQTSTDASVATNIKFPAPVYLEPNTEYALVAGSPLNTYEIFTAEMGQTALNEQELPQAVGRIYSNQFSIGSLFKSQNASTWTPTQFEDMTFVLYRADFVSTSAVVTLQNPPLRSVNGLLPVLKNNPIEALPKKAKVGFTTSANAGLIGTVFVPGRKVGDSTATYRYGYIENVGGPVLGVPGIQTGGNNYGTPGTLNVRTFNVTGGGTGLELTVTVGSGISAISAVSIASSGTGYKVGDIVGIVTADIGGAGSGARIGINSLGGIDTLYLTDVQAEEFETTAADLTYYHSTGTVIDSGVDILSYDATGSIYTGEYARVSFFNHGMYGSGNKVEIIGVEPDTLPTETSTVFNNTTTTISVADTTGFDVFEGVLVSAANTGYAVINNEVVSYTSVGVNTLGGLVRGSDNTVAINHNQGSIIRKYEFGGVSLTKINTTHDVSSLDNLMDSFVIQINREGRSTDNAVLSVPQLSFVKNVHGGGQSVRSSRNFQFDAIEPKFDVLLSKETDSVATSIRTISGTSVDGEETSFVDQGFEPVILNQRNELQTTRIVASEVNENEKLGNLFRNKSLTARMSISNGGNSFSSPMFCLDTSNVLLSSNRINRPITNYALDSRANISIGDPHSSYYVSRLVRIKQPATSLRVIFDAFKPESGDFRVLYSLLKKDSEDNEETFELFPGYNNLVDIDGDGYGDVVIDPKNNDGTPDKLVVNTIDRFSEFQFTANDLPSFTGFIIKIVFNGSNQAAAPVIKNIRALALA